MIQHIGLCPDNGFKRAHVPGKIRDKDFYFNTGIPFFCGFNSLGKNRGPAVAYFSPIADIVSAIRPASSVSGARGLPFSTAQKAQLRVQISPSIRNVAVLWDQHSDTLGHLALWQIVLSFFCCNRLDT
jgi:hypothetical protein